MFTGDAPTVRENEFLHDIEGKTMHIDFLQVAHHGSNSSSSQNFLNAISPTLAIVSAGDKSYPTKQVVERLKGSGVNQILSTYNTGLIGIGVSFHGDVFIATIEQGFDVPFFIVAVCLVGFATLNLFGTKSHFDDLFVIRQKYSDKNFVLN